MKKIGIVLMTIGLVIIIFVIINFIKEKNQTLSPIPESEGVKVIFITPKE